MVMVSFDPLFEKRVGRVRDQAMKERIKKCIAKIIENPEIGKPMRFSRKGTREVYLGSFRLSYAFIPQASKLFFLDLYHKDEQ